MKLKVDQTFQQGLVAHKEGKFKEAEHLYRSILQIQPRHAEASHNLGIIALRTYQSSLALLLFKTALENNPRIEQFWISYIDVLIKERQFEGAKRALKKGKKRGLTKNNFNILFQQLISSKNLTEPSNVELKRLLMHFQNGRYEDAEKLAILITKQFPTNLFSWKVLGGVFKQTGRISKALVVHQKTLEIAPEDAEAHYNFGNTLKDLGKHANAIECYKQTIKINSGYSEAYYNMGSILENIKFIKHMPDLAEIICQLLDKKTFVRPRVISKAIISLLKFDPVIKSTIKKCSTGKLLDSLQDTLVDLSNIPLLLKLMKICPLPDLQFESLLKNIRSAILLSISIIKNNSEILTFQIALSSQCFTNEYLYDQTDLEIQSLKDLEILVEKKLNNGEQPSSSELACLASYKALHTYSWVDSLSIPIELESLKQRQILEPREETQLSHKIPRLQEIKNNVSCKVRGQYEQNPYPRWVNLGLPLIPKSISTITKELKLKITNLCINEVNNPQILVAGCGTGEHSIGVSSTFNNCDVLAIDLSLSSLAYAKRKTEELDISNIKYMQADILDLTTLNQKFDVIESAGVLHHMEDPMAGWKLLTNCLKPGGLMRIALYSELARQDIVRIRDEIKQSYIDSNDDAMKSFRNKMVNSEEDHHKLEVLSLDFYSMSTFRDLLFHIQEHQFTIPQIKDCLTELGLVFCGFEANKIIKKFKLENLSENAVYDLKKWDTFEKQNPRIFSGMYQFWCQKI